VLGYLYERSGFVRYFCSALLFLLSFFTAPFSWAADPNIVIINSYHYGQDWSQSELDGIIQVLKEKYPNLLPAIEYLDTNRFGDKESLRKTSSFLIDKYSGRKADLVIALDNPALDLLLDHQAELFKGVPIVFAGINNFTPSMLKGQNRATGIAEVTDNRGALEIILKINPKTKRIIILNDNTITGKAIHNDLEPYLGMFSGNPEIIFYYPETFEEARDYINRLPQGSAVLIASLVADNSGKILSTPESTRMMTAGNLIPVYALRESRLGHGILGGLLLSGTEHGRRAGQLALRILSGEDPSSIPVDTSPHSIPMFDYKVMERLGVTMGRLPADSIVINKPVSFYEQNKTLFLSASLIIIILSLAIIVLLTNIMKRRRAEQRLLEVSRYTSALFEEARDTIFVIDIATGIILDANRAAEKLMKRSKSELIGMHQSKLYPSDDGSAAFRLHTRGLGNMVALEILTKNGDKTPVEISSTVMEFPDGKRILKSVFRDVSERNRLQEQLFHAQKMDAVGTLAGGVAHEFNNALTAIIGAAELLKMELPLESPYHNFTNIILGAAQTSSRLTQNLLSFCRKQIYKPQHIDVNTILLQQEKLFLKLIGEDIRVVKKLSETPCTVFADPGQIGQIIMNIALNAKDAMPGGGTLYITTELVKGRAIPEETSDSVRAADYVLIKIRDTGCGMDNSTRSKIFEPFFTTKEVGKGTGLGLSIVYGIVTQNAGFVDVKSEPGKGTEFGIFLPHSIDSSGKAQSAHGEERLRGMGAVLLAEDNDTVRNMQSMILKSGGYDVFEAVDGKSAVDLFRENADLISIVVLDVVMPNMDGKVAQDLIKKIRPDTKILFVSGHTRDFITSKGIDQDQADFLEKPFSPSQLLKKIRDMLQKEEAVEDKSD